MKYFLLVLLFIGCSSNKNPVQSAGEVQPIVNPVDTSVTRLSNSHFSMDTINFPQYNSSKFELANRWGNVIWGTYGPFEKDWGVNIVDSIPEMFITWLTVARNFGPWPNKIEFVDTFFVASDTLISYIDTEF